MKRYAVALLRRARREAAAIIAWWRVNRPAAPKLFISELRAAQKLLARFPDTGELDRSRGGEVRRLLLRRSRYYVFYRVDHSQGRVEILALWHTQRLPPAL